MIANYMCGNCPLHAILRGSDKFRMSTKPKCDMAAARHCIALALRERDDLTPKAEAYLEALEGGVVE